MGGLTICQCVRPDNGVGIPGTEVVVVAVEDIPNCDILSKKCRAIINRDRSRISYL